MMITDSKLFAGTLMSSFAALFLFAASAVNAADKTESDALLQAQKLEAAGNYNIAASAYLAIAEGFDFMPEKSGAPKLSLEERAIVGKCAISCLEQGMRQQGAVDEVKSNLDAQLLTVAQNTVKRLQSQSSVQTPAKSQKRSSAILSFRN